ncbi:sigma 54-interacting transcriptional regulator, partial [candidate division KSB1 bacterium]|nr:sigma 54-interacting transcriptional regulator [candidate division KSB1 bacterium]
MKAKVIEDEKILPETLAINQALLDALPDLMFILNKDAVYLDYKAGGNGDLYRAPNDFLGKRVDEVLPPDLARLSIRYIKRALKSRNVEIFEYQLEIEGELHDYECHMNAIDDRCVIAIVRDITERRLEAEKLRRLVESAPDSQERKPEDEELRTTREYLDTVILNMPAGLAILEGPEFKYFRINQELADINGLSVEEHLGRPLAEVLPQAAKDIVPVLQKVLDTGEATPRREFSTRLPKDPDEIRHFIDSFFPIKGQDGKVKAVGAVVLDIGERKRAEEMLAAKETLYRTLIDSIPHVIWLASAEGQATFLNKAWQEWTGRDVEESLGSKWAESVHPEDAPGLLAKWERAYKHGESYEGECRFKTKEGSYKAVTFIGTPVRDDSGKISNWVGINIDITERKRAEDALRDSENSLRKLVETTNVLPWESDVETWQFTYVGPQAVKFLGYPTEEWYEKDFWAEHIYPADREWAIDFCMKSSASGKDYEFEYRMLAADGRIVWFHDLVSVVSENGKPKVLRGFMLDITQRKKAEKALHEALEEIEQLKDRLQAENVYLQEEIKHVHNFDEIISKSEVFKKVLKKVEQVAATDATVLILGETGTGKELIARALHTISSRSERPLVKVNCAALPPTLIESELLGHEKGAFTGAVSRKPGRFELADQGTIFLDEIGDLPLDLQSKLLRVLQDGEFERVGGTQTLNVDVRVIAATNRDLKQAMQAGEFRDDLFYRLNVFPITLPPLRKHREDIP